MQFIRTKLIELGEAALVRHREQHDARVAREKDKQAKQLLDWFEDYEGPLREFAATVVRKLDAGEPVTDKDIPRSRRGYVSSLPTYHESSINETYHQPGDLVHLLGVLRSSTDEKISSSGLQTLGYANLHKIIPHVSIAAA